MKSIVLFVGVLLIHEVALAQHDHHTPPPVKEEVAKEDTASHHKHEMQDMSSMSHAFSINLPMNRNGSGTGWLPDASPMYGKMYHSGKWMYMLHGNAFLRYNNQDVFNAGNRGAEKFDAPNWLMGMAQRRVGKNGLLHMNLMMSLDAVIAGGEGYPLLFQSGETWKGKPLVDRQHPHDLISELSVSYAHAFSKKADVFVYLGYPGEPALGPVAFMHRPSAMPNPDATLSHHWTDATHITFGVATLGVRYGKFKLEGSSFTGREPDEDRYDFDKPLFDSRSIRLSYNPNKHWATQLSHAYIKSPEPSHPDEDIYRTTASAVYSVKSARGHLLNATALWGMNKAKGNIAEHSFLLEGSYVARRWMPYFRYEFVQKSSEELSLDENIYGHHSLYPIHALTIGSGYDIYNLGKIRLALGAHASFYIPDRKLQDLYGSLPLGVQAYLRIYPGLM